MIEKNKLPQELQNLRQWVCWRLEQDKRSGRDCKVPYSPNGGRRASPSNPSTWGTLDEALACTEKYLFSGIGFMFTAESGIIGIDVDHCLEDGKANEIAADILARLPPTWFQYLPCGNFACNCCKVERAEDLGSTAFAAGPIIRESSVMLSGNSCVSTANAPIEAEATSIIHAMKNANNLFDCFFISIVSLITLSFL